MPPTSHGLSTSSLLARTLGSLRNERVSWRVRATSGAAREVQGAFDGATCVLHWCSPGVANGDWPQCAAGAGRCRWTSSVCREFTATFASEPRSCRWRLRRPVNPSRGLRRFESFTRHPVLERAPDQRKRRFMGPLSRPACWRTTNGSERPSTGVSGERVGNSASQPLRGFGGSLAWAAAGLTRAGSCRRTRASGCSGWWSGVRDVRPGGPWAALRCSRLNAAGGVPHAATKAA
jgi:hypothetical protein